MSDPTFSIQKLGGDLDEALLRFSTSASLIGPVDCYLHNDELANLAHVIEKFLNHTEARSTSYTLGSFEPNYAGGALRVALARHGGELQFTSELIDDLSKGSGPPERLQGPATPVSLHRFAGALRGLHGAESGRVQLHLRAAPRTTNADEAALPPV